MTPSGPHLHVSSEVAEALGAGRPVVALESTLISHGLPWPINLETACAAEEAVRQTGALPATIAILDGKACVGLPHSDLERLAHARNVRKASRRDLAAALVQKACAGTTVSGTLALAHQAGIGVFATGGIGGVHRGTFWDVSADLHELARTPVALVCAGAKSILDLSATLELLETLGVPVLGWQTNTFPAFYLSSSGLPVSARVESVAEAANLVRVHRSLGGGGVLLAQALPAGDALDPETFARALSEAEQQAVEHNVTGPALTPFLLARLAEQTQGRSLQVNRTLIVANARLAGQIAVALSGDDSQGDASGS